MELTEWEHALPLRCAPRRVFVVGPIVGAIIAVPLYWLASQPALDRFKVEDKKVRLMGG